MFQDPALFRYNTQVAALIGLIVTAAAITLLADRLTVAIGVVAAAMVAIVALAWVVMPELVNQVVTDLNRFRPDPTRMAVLEARPLFLYTGNWEWSQPWTFFRSGFYVGLIAVAALVVATWRSRRVDHLLILCFTVANYLATFGQNRFGYYLVPSTAVVISWLAIQILDWGGVPHADNPDADDQATAAVSTRDRRDPGGRNRRGAEPRAGGAHHDACRRHAGVLVRRDAVAAHQHARAVHVAPTITTRVTAKTNPPAGFSVMNWWDQGYWIMQTGRRVPVSNPTQSGATKSAAFLTATDEADALAQLAADRARYVIVDWELPFRDGADGALAGRFQNLADWAGVPTSRFYSLCFSRRTRGGSVAADVALSRGLLPDDGVSIDGAGRRRIATRSTTPSSSTSGSDRTSAAAPFAKWSIAGSSRTPKKPRSPHRNVARLRGRWA